MGSIRSVLTIFCLCLIFGIGVKSYAQPPKMSSADLKEQMQRHIEKVKIKSPQKYRAMVQEAGSNITDCLSCHKDIIKRKKR